MCLHQPLFVIKLLFMKARFLDILLPIIDMAMVKYILETSGQVLIGLQVWIPLKLPWQSMLVIEDSVILILVSALNVTVFRIK